MGELRIKQHVSVTAVDEIVVFMIANAQAKFTYRAALRHSQHMRINAKSCMRHVEGDSRDWRKAQLEEGQIGSLAKLQNRSLMDAIRTIRVAPLLLVPATPSKRVWFENFDETVRMHLGSTAHVDFHYEDALKISGWLRVAGKQAKFNSGDRFKELSAVGSLHDAAA